VPDIIVDAGPLIAAFSKSDRFHTAALAFFARSETTPLVTNLLVVGEVAAVLGMKHAELATCLTWIHENLEIDANAGADLPRAIEIMGRYRDLPADLADASLVALCERRKTTVIASIDRDFGVYRLPKNRKFANVFFNDA
jgi:uncharacterized protein